MTVNVRNKKSFVNGLIKLEQNILDSVLQTTKTGLIVPFIQIPEELDPTFGISFDANFEDIYNASTMFDFITSEINFQTDLTSKDSKSYLKKIFENEIENEYLSKECVDLTKDTINLIDMTLACELSKEVSDAYYIAMESLSNDIVNTIYSKIDDDQDNDTFIINVNRVKTSLLNSLIDPNWHATILSFIGEFAMYKRMPDIYTAYNYEFLFRNRVMNHISFGVYSNVRDFLYKLNITPLENPSLYEECYNKITHTYLYVFDTMLQILCKAFQYKIALCWNDMDILVKGIIEVDDENEDPLLIEDKG